MATDPEFGRRLRTAKREYEARHDCELTQGELAQRVAELAGVENLSAQAVGQWLNRGQEPSSLALLRALAEVLEVGVARLAGEDLTPAQQRGLRELAKTQAHVPPVPPYTGKPGPKAEE